MRVPRSAPLGDTSYTRPSPAPAPGQATVALRLRLKGDPAKAGPRRPPENRNHHAHPVGRRTPLPRHGHKRPCPLRKRNNQNQELCGNTPNPAQDVITAIRKANWFWPNLATVFDERSLHLMTSLED